MPKKLKTTEVLEVEVPSDEVIQKYHKFVAEVQSMSVRQVHQLLDALPEPIRELMYLYFKLKMTTAADWKMLRMQLIDFCGVPDSEKDKQGDPWLVDVIAFHLQKLRDEALILTAPASANKEFNPFGA